MNTPETDELIRLAAERIRCGVDDIHVRAMIFNEVKNSEKAFLILTAARLLAKN